MFADAIARKGDNFYFAFFVRRARSSQTHLGFFNFQPVARKEAQAEASDRGTTDAPFSFDGYRVQWLQPSAQEAQELKA